MRSFLMMLGSLLMLLVLFLGGIIITAHLVKPTEAHRFANVEAPDLWTSKPVIVDRSKQSFERLPDARVSSEFAGAGPADDSLGEFDSIATASIGVQADSLVEADPVVPVIGTRLAEICAAKYRSYRAEDNSYQPFGGGPRKQCSLKSAQNNPIVASASTR